MRKFIQTIFLSCIPAIGLSCGGIAEDPINTTSNALTEDTFYVVAFPGPLDQNLDQIVANAGGELLDTLPAISAALIRSNQKDFSKNLKKVTTVTAIGEHNFQLAPEAEATYQLDNTTPPQTGIYFDLYQWDIRRVHAPEAWATTSGSHNTVVAVLDTGVAWNHPDLAPNVIFASCASVLGPCNPYPSISSHGTHVAGTIAASEGLYMTGVGPNLAIASYNVFEHHPLYGVVAFDWPLFVSMLDAAERGFDVINMSLGGYLVRPSSQEHVAAWTLWNRVAKTVTKAGTTIVAAAGNGNFNQNGPVSHIPSDLPSVISVSATGIGPAAQYPFPGSYDVRAFYSDYGASVTLAAPGGDVGPDELMNPWHWHLIFSAYVFLPIDDFGDVPKDCPLYGNCPVGFAWMGGTSMAAPHVAGVAGLIRDVNPGLSANQVASKLKRTAEPLGDRQFFGHGMVNAAEAVK